LSQRQEIALSDIAHVDLPANKAVKDGARKSNERSHHQQYRFHIMPLL
jgi:hypothetical protein